MSKTHSLKKINRNVPLSLKVEEQLRKAIFQKVYAPGERLPSETDLVEIFGISRTAIREALRMLAGQGLIDIRGRSGAFVVEIDSSHAAKPLATLLLRKCGDRGLINFIQARKEIEPGNARLAAIHRTEEDIRHLEKYYTLMKENVEDAKTVAENDSKFHNRIAQATQNPIIPIIMEPIFLLLPQLLTVNLDVLSHRQVSLQHHQNILDCIIREDADGAFQAMLEHMNIAEEHVKEAYEKNIVTEIDEENYNLDI